MPPIQSPTMLVILDGFGYSSQQEGNAVASAHMPTWNMLTHCYPHALLHASGQFVGLLPGYMGNSEVGHLTLGAGRVIKSFLKKIHDSIDDGSFFTNKILIDRFTQLKKSGGALHLMGLVSDGGVHSHEYHLYALIRMAKKMGLERVFIHAFLDGRDVAPTSAAVYLERLEAFCSDLGCGQLASIHGRFYAMDRDKNFDRTQLSYQCLTGQLDKTGATSWREVLSSSYRSGITDEFIQPVLLVSDGYIKSGDGVVFFNFRPDRAQQLTECFLSSSLRGGAGGNTRVWNGPQLSFFISMTLYKEEFAKLKNDVLFKRELVEHTLLDVLAEQPNPPKVFIIAETEKYAHVTYFFRGMVDKQLPNEQRVLVPSVKMKSYANFPQMSAPTITQHILHSLETDPADFYLVNYANADMVGHSGDLQATIQACQVLDQQLTTLYNLVVLQMNGTLFIVSDHGNAEEKIDSKTGEPRTAHTTNPVPFVMVNKSCTCGCVDGQPTEFQPPVYGLAHVSPTILKHLGLKVPDVMLLD